MSGISQLMVTNWLWFGSRTPGGIANRTAKSYYSSNGLDWVQMTAEAWDYKDPDWLTNNSNGPITTEQCPQWKNRRWESVYNYDPYNTNGNAQALGFAVSYDFVHWQREALYWPFGKTNAGAMFAATWFTDNDGSNYLVTAWAIGEFGHPKNIYTMRRLDNSLTNWSEPSMIVSNDLSMWDGQIVRVGNRYDLYTLDSSTSIARFTNSQLNTTFTLDSSTVFSPHGDYVYNGEAPSIIQISTNNWRMYFKPDYMVWGISTNLGNNWGDVNTTNRFSYDPWHGPGIVMHRVFPSLTVGGCVVTGVR